MSFPHCTGGTPACGPLLAAGPVTAFRQIGGAVISDVGAISLRTARELARFYGLEALHEAAAGERRYAHTCARRSLALHDAAEGAARWRRAAGWRDPEAADG